MSSTAIKSRPDANKAAPRAAKNGAAKSLPPYFGPRHFDPAAHGGVKKLGFWFLFFGVILPTVAMIYECSTHYCAQHYFDPFPSTGHALLFALIPLSNLLSWWGTRRDLSNHFAAMSLMSGMAMGVGILYALMFLPITAAACMATAFFGFGLLALAPVLSLPCNLLSAKTVGRLSSRKTTYFNAHQVDHIGHMIILVMVIAVELPSTLTRINLSRSADPAPFVSQDAVQWLRKYGSTEVLQRACYEHSGRATDILGSVYESGHPLSVAAARRTFFRVTGKPFNSVPIPMAARATIQRANMTSDASSLNFGVNDEFDLDTDIAGESVSGMARGLSLAQSSMSGTLDGDSALGTVEWSLAFGNISKVDREARAKILLPPQAVVTKATLIVRDREYNATVMVREAARAKYQASVNARKEPLLVSMVGGDQLLVQCYPVSAGETVRVRLQMAMPLTIREDNKAALTLPTFMERNFVVDKPTDVDFKTNSRGNVPFALTAASLTNLSPGRVSGALTVEQLARFESCVLVDRGSAAKTVHKIWCKGDRCFVNSEVERSLQAPRYVGVKHLLVLIDGSIGMKSFLPEIVDGLKALPPALEATVQIAGDQPTYLYSGSKPGGSADYLASISALKKFEMTGGQDDFASLRNSIKEVAIADDTAVLWLHAAQPISDGDSSEIAHLLTGAFNRPYLFDMELQAGPDELLNGVYSPNGLVRVPRAASVREDLISFFSTCREIAPTARAEDQDKTVAKEVATRAYLADNGIGPVWLGSSQEYECHPTVAAVGANKVEKNGEREDSLEVDDRLLKIWANRQIAIDMQKAGGDLLPGCNIMANLMQIVSPVSSAVVVQTETPLSASNLSDKKAGQNVGRVEDALKQAQTFTEEKAKSLSRSIDNSLSKLQAPSLSAELFSSEPSSGPDAFSSLGGNSSAASDSAAAPAVTTAPTMSGYPGMLGATNGTLSAARKMDHDLLGAKNQMLQGVNTAGTVRLNERANAQTLFMMVMQIAFVACVLGAIVVWCRRRLFKK